MTLIIRSVGILLIAFSFTPEAKGQVSRRSTHNPSVLNSKPKGEQFPPPPRPCVPAPAPKPAQPKPPTK